MKGEPVKPGKGVERSGPQGTQVFSRDQLAEIFEEGADADDGRSQARLVLLTSHPESRESDEIFRLSTDRVTVGRSKVCDLCIEEPSMSSEHARLVYSDNAWRVINLLSTNGVYVNDQKVFSHRLNDGDEIRLGRARLRFRDPEGGRPSPRGGFARPWLLWTGGSIAAVAAGAAVLWLLQ